MQFEYPVVLLLLLILPLLVYFRCFSSVRELKAFYTRHHFLSVQSPTGQNSWFNTSIVKRSVLGLVYFIGLASLVLALARPQLIEPLPPKKEDGLDIMVAIDVSPSMEALDFELGGKAVNRLTALQHVLGGFIDRRPADRFGLVVFGAAVFTQSPLSYDHSMVKTFLKETFIGMVGDGTAIGDAVATGIKRLDSNRAKSKILILLTDGAQTAGKMTPQEAALAAQTLGVKIYTIGIGKSGQVPYPVQDPFFGRRIIYRQSDLDEKTLKSIADISGGQFYRASDTESFEKIYNEINSLEKDSIERQNEVIRHEKYRPYALFGVSMLLVFFLFSNGFWGLRNLPLQQIKHGRNGLS